MKNLKTKQKQYSFVLPLVGEHKPVVPLCAEGNHSATNSRTYILTMAHSYTRIHFSTLAYVNIFSFKIL